MGVDTVIRLPPNVTLHTVADVIGKLLGCEATKESLGGNGSWHAEVHGVKTADAKGVVGCASIDIQPPGEDAEARWFLYHFEGPGGTRLLMPRATAKNIAMCRALVNFIGGQVEYNDCDSHPYDYAVGWQSDEDNSPDDGEPWHRMQQRILDLPALTEAEIDACEEFAAYKSESPRGDPKKRKTK